MNVITKSFTSDVFIASYPVKPEHDGMRLDSFVLIAWASISREMIKRKISRGEIVISNRKVPHKASTKIHTGEKVTITVNRTSHEDVFWRGEKLDLPTDIETIYEDDNIITISKPPYMSTHPTGIHLFYCATILLEEKYKKIHSIHRLDRETSGVLVLGKNSHSSMKVADEFMKSNVKKCYFLIAHKTPQSKQPPFTAYERLGKDEENCHRMFICAFDQESDRGKPSETGFEMIFEDDKYTLMLAFPKTGRQHQIRVHACHHGYPLLGDKLYHGGIELFQRFKDKVATEEDHNMMQLPRQALHSIAINFPYYANKNKDDNKLTVITKIPQDLKAWINTNINCPIEELEKRVKTKIQSYFDKK